MKLLCRGLILLSLVLIISCEDDLLLQTKNGLLQGKYMQTDTGKEFRAFLGIPYAKPPVGKLRFQPPKPMEPWNGVRDATHFHTMCPQMDIFLRRTEMSGHEDCLFLNVYTPQVKDLEKNKPLSVMVFIHGGAFVLGSGDINYYGPNLLLDKDIVLVTINYRLGALGFLSFGDEEVPGNNGLKDQNFALQWVKNNIKDFGGDPNSVTIFGESAGAGSTHLHMMSPMSKGLFHAVISQSGVSTCPWAVYSLENGVKISKKLAEILHCFKESTTDMVNCLREKTIEEIVYAQHQFAEWDTDPAVIFRPVQEIPHKGAFITQHPRDIIKSGKASEVPWMIGTTSDEGAFRVSAYVANNLLEDFDKNFNKVLPSVIAFDNFELTNKNVEEIRKFYFGDKALTETNVQNIVDLLTDTYFVNCSEEAVNLHYKYMKSPIYYYLFGYSGSKSFATVFGDKKNSYGACHVDDLLYLFSMNEQWFPNPKQTKADLEMVQIMTTLWTNFAKYKEPTPHHKHMEIKWKPVDSKNNEFFHIHNPKDLSMKKKDANQEKRVKFWKKLQKKSSKTEL